MNTKHISLAFAAVVTLLAGCAKSPIEETTNAGGLTDLELAYVGSNEVKSVIDGTDFPQTGEIGLFLFGDEAATTPYGETGYTNVKYAYNSTKGKWTASPSIKVGSTPGYLYGYYPYSSEAESIKAIPVASSLDGDDVMYASKQNSPITDQTASQTAITMNHALSRVSITVKNNGYTGNAKLTSIKFAGAKTSETGTLDATTGTISGTTKADVTLAVPEGSQTITATGTTYECLLVPSEKDETKQEVTLTLKIDGQDKTATLSGENGVIIAQNTKSNITITLSNSGISVQTVSVDDWNVVEIGGHKVTITVADGVDPKDILTKAYVDGNSVIIRAYSYSGHHLKCTMPDGDFCTSQSKTDKLVYDFIISDITANTTATIGYAEKVSVAVKPANAGRVDIEGLQDKDDYFEGEIYKHKAIPNEGYCFVNWQDQYGNVLCESEEYTFRPSSKVDVTAVFDILYSLKVFVSPSYAGSISAFSKWNVKGTEITLTTTPCGNSEFIGWKDKDGNILSDEKTYTFTIESDTVLIADYSVDYGTDALDGIFTVAADNGYGKPKKVRFSKGNLWYGKTSEEATSATFNFEENQWNFKVSTSGSFWDPDHISHFMWSKDATIARQQTYSDPQASVDDVLFPNSENFSVNGVSVWYALSIKEWPYLLGDSDERNGKHKKGVTIGDIMGLVIAPDNFEGTINSTYTDSEWMTAESNDGLIFLPAAGYRSSNCMYLTGGYGYYWSASLRYIHAYGLHFDNSFIYPDYADAPKQAYAVRLVTDVK